jgi:hypothetical protein
MEMAFLVSKKLELLSEALTVHGLKENSLHPMNGLKSNAIIRICSFEPVAALSPGKRIATAAADAERSSRQR